jgi:hypothetical protein
MACEWALLRVSDQGVVILRIIHETVCGQKIEYNGMHVDKTLRNYGRGILAALQFLSALNIDVLGGLNWQSNNSCLCTRESISVWLKCVCIRFRANDGVSNARAVAHSRI